MMDTFVVDKPFYDAEEFKELWDENDLDPVRFSCNKLVRLH